MEIRRDNRRWLMYLGVFVAIALFTFLACKFKSIEEDVSAANLKNFNAGYIISDYQMSNYNSMSEADIQRFLTAKNPCDNRDYSYYLQLSANKNYKWHWSNGHFVCLSEERFGDGEVIGSGDTAAHIIWKAAQDYKINPQVLLVLLQKETSLITDRIPNNGDYRKATGYGCPDTAPCSSEYYGFKNQVRKAAALFREVLDGGWTNYSLGNNYVQYNPNPGCGGTTVNIRNLATSALYRYTPYQPNAAALNSGGDGCSAYGNRNFYSYFEDWFGGITSSGLPSLSVILSKNRVAKEKTDLELSYRTHIAEFGWLGWTNGSEMSGTSGYSLRVEALAIKLGNSNKGIEYRTHVQDVGWTNYVKDGAISGTTGQSRQVEAVQIRLTGDMAKIYDVYYRTHVQDVGWTGWSKNDEVSGTTGQSKRVEAIQIKIVKKTSIVYLQYQAHVQDIGWMNWIKNGKLAGTTGQSKRVEALRIKLPDDLVSLGSISYQAHVQDIGWMSYVKDGATSGTTGQSKRVEALRIKLTGELANKYDIYYRSHTQDIGWTKWVKNDAQTGTTGQSKRMEAVEITMVKK